MYSEYIKNSENSILGKPNKMKEKYLNSHSNQKDTQMKNKNVKSYSTSLGRCNLKPQWVP